jgi:chaperonin GroEL
LAERLAETVSFAGPDAYIEVLNHEPRRIDRDYVEGSLIETPWHNANFATDAGRTITRMEDAPFAIVDTKIESAEHAANGLKRIHEMGHTKIAIMVGEVSEEAMNFFNMVHHRGAMQVALVKSPGYDATRALHLQDIAALTGARLVMGDGAGFASITAEDLGLVRRLWVNKEKLGLIGGQRDSLTLRTQIEIVRKEIEGLLDMSRLTELRKRLGRLTSSWVMLRVGGATSGQAEARQDAARRLVRALQMAVRSGVVAGGGAAFVQAGSSLSKHEEAKRRRHKEAGLGVSELDYAMGVKCVVKALEAPMTAILQNAGHDPSPILVQVREAGAPHGFDVKAERVANMLDAGVVDSTEVLVRALRNAGSMAGMAITTEAVVHHKKPSLQVAT